MPRMFRIVVFSTLLSATTMIVACKTDKPAGKKPDEATKVVDPARARPADPAVKPPEPPAEPTTSDPEATGKNSEVESKGIAMMQRMGDLFAAGANDCEKLATDIRTLVASNRELLVQLNVEQAKQTEKERSAFMARNKAVQDAVMAKMGPAVQACGTNKSFQAALRDVPTE